MLSKITIEIDHDNQPVIKIDYKQSSDVRDSLVKRFLETFGHHSSFSTSYFTTPAFGADKSMIIRPIPPYDMRKQQEEYSQMLEHWETTSLTPPPTPINNQY